MGTRYNRLNEAVLTCTHNICFEQKYENSKKNQLKIAIFYSREKLLYIAWACFRNEMPVEAILMHFETMFACEIRLIVQAFYVVVFKRVSNATTKE